MNDVVRLTLPAQSLESAEGRAKEVLDTALRQVGFIPNMYAKMVNSPGLLDTYLFGYNAFRKESGFTPAEQEVVFLTISRVNECAYCMAAHSMLAEAMSKTPPQAIAALREDRPIDDPKLRALANFTRVMVESRGRPTDRDAQDFFAAGYSNRQVLEVILAIAVKTLSNYANDILHTEVDPRFEGYAWQPREK